MFTDKERALVAKTLLLCFDDAARSSKKADTVKDWVERNEIFLGLDLARLRRKSGKAKKDADADASKSSRADWRFLRTVVTERAALFDAAPKDTLARNVNHLCKLAKLDKTDRKIVELVARATARGPFGDLCDDIIYTRFFDSDAIVARLSGIDEAELRSRLSGGPLCDSTIVETIGDHDHAGFRYALPSSILSAVSPPIEGFEAVHQALLGPRQATWLSLADFEHLGLDRRVVEGLLTTALRERVRGVNVLLYGAPGTGKTEFCKALAARINARLFAVGEQRGSWMIAPRSRLASLCLAQRIASNYGNAVLLFDEFEDIVGDNGRFVGRGMGPGSKLFLNRLLENNAVPTLWTTNQIESIDPAIIRRFSHVVRFRLPPTEVRRATWTKSLNGASFVVSEQSTERLAKAFPVSSGVIANAARTAKLARADEETLSHVVRSMLNALGQSAEGDVLSNLGAYDLTLLNASEDPVRLVDRLTGSGSAQDFSLCLFGPPGTGKTAFARHLAWRLDMDVSVKRGSDLLSRWIGDTESNIRDAFVEARDQRKVLIFDEVDSLLMDRREAVRSWELSQVNELLSAMERHDLPFVCTTNFIDRLDPAVMRRFTFKIRCDFLSEDQAARAFETYFGKARPASLRDLRNLTPGDFAVIAKAMRYRAEDVSAEEIADMLRRECELKPGSASRIGF